MKDKLKKDGTISHQGEGGGVPKFVIDYDQVEKLAGLQCTQDEIASYLGCCVDTLQRDERFSGLYKAGMDKGRMSLRRKQWRAADDGNTTMLVWLGKQYLRQTDKQDISSENTHRVEIQEVRRTFVDADPGD